MLTTRNLQLGLAALLAVCAVASTSCKKDRPDSIIPKDAGQKDTGVEGGEDASTIEDTGTNPPPDSGVPPMDSGVTPMDSGMPPADSGVQMAECAVAADCTAPDDTCARFVAGMGLVTCAGEDTCQCWQECDPFVAVDQSGCARPAEACGSAGGVVAGVCIPDMGGSTQGQACTSMFNGMDYAGDSCNGAQNFFCQGSDPLDVAGNCVRLCDTANGALCTSLDPNTECTAFNETTTQGVCQVVTTDLGSPCTTDNECQGGYCAPELGNQCTQQCGVTFVCSQAEGICVGGAQISPLCAHTCTFGAAGDTECAAVNPDTICLALGTPADPLDICLPRCTMDADCQDPANPTCDVASGHCGP